MAEEEVQATEVEETQETEQTTETVDQQEQTQETTQETQSEPSWRQKYAGEDAAALKRLERFADESAFFKSYRALEQKLSSGEYKQVVPYPENGSDEQKAEWRKANGIPDQPEGYVESLKLPEGLVPGEADKPGLDRLAQYAAEKNWSQDTYNAVMEAYYNEAEARQNMQDEEDDSFHQNSEDSLRGEWGDDYRRNVNAVHNLLAGAPDDVKDRLFGGRTADGKLIGDDPSVLKWLAQVSLDMNPAASVLPSGSSPDAFKGRLEALENMAKDANSDYYEGVNSKELQAEHLKLLEAQEKMNSRAA